MTLLTCYVLSCRILLITQLDSTCLRSLNLRHLNRVQCFGQTDGGGNIGEHVSLDFTRAEGTMIPIPSYHPVHHTVGVYKTLPCCKDKSHYRVISSESHPNSCVVYNILMSSPICLCSASFVSDLSSTDIKDKISPDKISKVFLSIFHHLLTSPSPSPKSKPKVK